MKLRRMGIDLPPEARGPLAGDLLYSANVAYLVVESRPCVRCEYENRWKLVVRRLGERPRSLEAFAVLRAAHGITKRGREWYTTHYARGETPWTTFGVERPGG